MSFDFYLPTRILFGKGKLNELSRQKLPGKKALIVTSSGPSMKKYGYLARLEEQLDKANVEHVLFDKILPNPIVKHVMEGAALAKESGCDFVIGLGGGSSIDSAKAIAVMATNEGHYWDYVSGGSGKGKPVPNDPLPIVAITTTAGTGTEADPWTVITNGKEKIGFGYEKTFPTLSIVDPELMMTVPPHLTAYQGFDALFHSTEGYLNITANEMSDLFALKAISLLGKSLPAAVADGSNEAARTDVALANTFAGIVEFTSGCISEHSIEHALSAFHPELPHGAGLIMISKAYYTFIAKSGTSDERMVEMAKALGKSDASDPMDFVDALHELQVQCGVDNLKMSDYGIKPEEFEDLAANALETMGGLFEVDPCKITHADIVQILRDSYR
ncbi:MAG: iron-containing alcohol dehydrogenase [Firmicutes bacterium]|nr:iron-containing alcohol dehydrogenase [Bacillota bacterium]